MLNLRNTLFALAAVLLSACSGGGDNTIVGVGGGTGPVVEIGSLTLITSQPQILSDGSDSATLTAIVRDENNNTVEGVSVIFAADSGSLAVTNPAVTDANGAVTAVLSTPSNFQNRAITVTATANQDYSDTLTVQVTGTTLLINGPNSLALGDVGNYNVVLADASGTGIPGQSISITSGAGNAVSVSPVSTDVTGQASFSLTANAGGTDTLTAQSLGIVATHPVTISADTFSFTAPAANTEIPLNTPQTFDVQWLVGGAAVADGSLINFSSTRGTVSAAQVATAGGTASVTVTATNAGPAVVTATNSDGTSTQRVVEFIATAPAEVELQASPFTIGPQEQSALTAIVRDAAGNLVKNQVVVFSLDDVTGGSLSVAQGTTNSQGRVQTFYTSSTQTSASDGVEVTATVQGTAFTDTVALTVSERELFISIGTGNSIEEPNVAQYLVLYVVQVTDAQGNGVPNKPVQLNLLSLEYMKGEYVWNGSIHVPVVSATCPDEDVNRNGILDPGEDANGSGLIEAGNIATATAEGTGGGTVTTDADGFAFVEVVYPQNFANWVRVRLEATASVAGTEFSEPAQFVLPVAALDVNVEGVSPPGDPSPFGISANCGDTL